MDKQLQKTRFFCYYLSTDVLWFRVLGRGLAFKRTPPLFSERNGYRRSLTLLGGWRVSLL